MVRYVVSPIPTSYGPILTNISTGPTARKGQAEQQADPSQAAVKTDQPTLLPGIEMHSPDCDKKWNRLQKLWNKTDAMISDIITEARGGPHQRGSLKAGKPELAQLKEEFVELESCASQCQRP